MAMHADFDHAERERLLTREGRASLSLGRLLIIYLDPFALFMDALRGPAWRRELALSYNRARRAILLTYVRRWVVIAGGSFFGIAFSEALAAHAPLFFIPVVGFGIGFSVASTVAVCTAAAYVLLGISR